MINKDISANLHHKWQIRCSKIVQEVLHNMLPWKHPGSEPSRIKRLFWPPFALHNDICHWQLICMRQRRYKNVRPSSWPCLMIFKLKITNMLKSGQTGLEKRGFPSEHNFYLRSCAACRSISLPSFNGFCSKLTEISVISLAYFTHFSNLNISGTNADISKA